MKAKIFVSLCLSAVLAFALPVSAGAAETAEAAPAYEEPEASGEAAGDADEIIEPGVQAEDQTEEDMSKASVSSEVFPCYLYDLENKFDLTLYFINDVKDLPYVNLSEWLDVMVTLYQSVGRDEGYGLTLETDGNVAEIDRESGYSMIIDFENSTISFDDYDAFMHKSGDDSLLDMVSSNEVDEKGNPVLFERIERGSFDRYGSEVEIDLAAYDIPLYWSAEDGLYLLPMQTMNDLLIAQPILSSFYFNGEGVYLADERTFGLTDPELTPLGEAYYGAPYGEMSEELAWYNYCELCLALDHLYGLKEIHDITTFDRIFTETGYRQDLSSTDPNVADGALIDFINYYLDDLHSGFTQCSFRTEDPQMIGGAGLANRLSNSDAVVFMEARRKADHEITTYEEVGNTAYITFDEFDILKSASEYYEGENEIETNPAADPLDTVALLLYAHKQINREDSPIENVVIDLSLNGGGALDAAAFVAAWYLGEGQMSIRNSLTGAVSTGVYRADVNLDGEFDEKDTVEDKNLFCLISPYSFSCGNLIPNIFKASHKVTLIGQTSGGGSCSVLPMSTASGSMFQISSPNRMSYMKNGSYYDIDTGIDPDCVIVKPENFYNREALTEYINQLF